MQTSYASVNKIGFMANVNTDIDFICNSESRMQKIIITDLGDEVIFESDKPTEAWNYQSVKSVISHLDLSDGANLYFGSEWIGCTEL